MFISVRQIRLCDVLGGSMQSCDFHGADLAGMDLEESWLCTIEVLDAEIGKK